VPVSLNFKGEEVFKTFIGGVLTFVYLVIILVFSILQFSIVINRKQSTINTNEIFKDLIHDKSPVFPGIDDFLMGVGGYNENNANPNYMLDPDYFTIKFSNSILKR